MQMGIPIENPDEPLRDRLWRRAVVLAGNTEAATRIIAAILREEPTLERMSETRLEQRIVQLSRQWRREEPTLTMGDPELPFAADSPAGTMSAGLDGLSAGLRESWMLCEGFKLEPEAVALMLSESTAAVRSRLAEASEELSDDGSPVSQDAMNSVHTQIRAIKLDERHERVLQSARNAGVGRRRRAGILWILVILLITLGLVLILRDLMGWDESQAEREQFIRERSNLLPSAEELTPPPIGQPVAPTPDAP